MADREIGIGLVGVGWMGNVHSRAYRELPTLRPFNGVKVRLAHVADEVPAVAEEAQRRWGYERMSTDWRAVVEDPNVDVVDIAGPNQIHSEVAVAAAGAGKHVYCEKPVGRSLAEVAAAAEAVRQAGVKSFTGYNYRWMPSIRHARDLIAQGSLGRITHLRTQFLTGWGLNPNAPCSWRFVQELGGWGALGDVGGHVIDTIEFLAGPITDVVGVGEIFIPRRPALSRTMAGGISVFGQSSQAGEWHDVTNEDYFSALFRLKSGAMGTIELSRVIAGPKSPFRIGVNGSEGAFSWDLERMNEFELYQVPTTAEDGDDGFRRVLSNPQHPGYGMFSPAPGVGPGFADSKTIEIYHFLGAIARDEEIEPSFKGSLRVATILDALQRSWASRTWQHIEPPAPQTGTERQQPAE